MSDTCISQCMNFLIFKMNHPVDVEYIRKMVPNISDEIVEKQKSLQSGTCLGFGTAFKIPLIIKMQMPDPAPWSGNVDVVKIWNGNSNQESYQQQSSNPQVNANIENKTPANNFTNPNEIPEMVISNQPTENSTSMEQIISNVTSQSMALPELNLEDDDEGFEEDDYEDTPVMDTAIFNRASNNQSVNNVQSVNQTTANNYNVPVMSNGPQAVNNNVNDANKTNKPLITLID